jgi:predicted transcriptional regulator of viral defense system
LERVSRGLYVPGGQETSEHYMLALVRKRVPQGVIGLLSALRFHELGTQQPFEVWPAIPVKGWTPHAPDPADPHRPLFGCSV